jgi:ubiquinone/menaquinone biosynthesis C-methylase UbiE
MSSDSSFDIFNADAEENAGYRYTTNASLSSRLANRRITDAALSVADFRDKRVLDIGCGDGTYSVELIDVGGAASVLGLEPAEQAVAVARSRIGDAPLSFEVGSAYAIPFPSRSFDIAYIRGVLHHVDRPVDVLREALRVAATVVVVEPNGYNMGLKVLERVSKYHRDHAEKSYAPRRLDRWIGELGGHVVKRQWTGFVPMFAPDWFARSAKRVEPVLERLPLLRAACCAQYVFAAAAD